jgi:hypothetical protein
MALPSLLDDVLVMGFLQSVGIDFCFSILIHAVTALWGMSATPAIIIFIRLTLAAASIIFGRLILCTRSQGTIPSIWRGT